MALRGGQLSVLYDPLVTLPAAGDGASLANCVDE
jgi:hypothetical protein